MRIAVAYEKESGKVFQHFGYTEYFKLYDVENGKVTNSLVIAAQGAGHEALADFLAQLRANALICGAVGGGARAALEDVGVILYGGVSGSADAAVNAFLDGALAYDPDVHCNHPDQSEIHVCGAHDCLSEHHDCGGCKHHLRS